MEQRSESSIAGEQAEERVQLYDVNTIDSLSWPSTEDGAYAHKVLYPLIKNGVRHYIDNIDTEMKVLRIDDLVLPITVNESQYENSYVCSPYGHYVIYTFEFLSNLKSRVLGGALKILIKSLGKVLRWGNINRVVIVNNWMFSTNLYPQITQEQIQQIKKFLENRFPSHAILFRSVHTFKDNGLYQSLKRNKFNLIASRQVYLLNTHDEAVFQTRIFKSDLKLLRECDSEVISHRQLSLDDVPKISAFYNSIYLDKHSKQNPQLNSNFIKLALENQVLHLKALRKEGSISAVVGYFCRNGTMTSPFLGYDTSLPQNNKLYRLASTLLTLEAKERKLLLHLSSGAHFYKKIRRAEGNIEYMAVYHKHLPFVRRFPWYVLQGIINSIGIPFMKYADRS